MVAPEVEVCLYARRLRRERALGVGQRGQLLIGQPNAARVSNLKAAKARCNAVLLRALQRAIRIFHLKDLLTGSPSLVRGFSPSLAAHSLKWS